ncbi:MAG: hypothetical protein IPK83_22645 [Planctomycetes bacterium]|nr:hypothetical protein [Planctomycetota bacterium]
MSQLPSPLDAIALGRLNFANEESDFILPVRLSKLKTADWDGSLINSARPSITTEVGFNNPSGDSGSVPNRNSAIRVSVFEGPLLPRTFPNATTNGLEGIGVVDGWRVAPTGCWQLISAMTSINEHKIANAIIARPLRCLSLMSALEKFMYLMALWPKCHNR